MMGSSKPRSLIFALIASLAVLAFLFSLNFLIAPAVRRSTESGVKIDSVKRLSKASPLQKEKQTQRKQQSMKSLLQGLSSLGGSSFDIAAFDSLLDAEEEADSLNKMGLDAAPNPKKLSEAPYPSSAKKKGLEGHVVVNILINEEGRVEKAQVLESSPPGVFEDSALETVKKWIFYPARKSGKSVAVWVQKTIRFSLQ